MTETLLYANNLTRGYDNSPGMVFYRFSFALYKRDFAVISGPSGSGKTTLAKLCTGILTPPRTSIFHKNTDISRFTSHEMQLYRRSIGYIFQDCQLIEYKTVAENIGYPLSILEVPLAIKLQSIDAMIHQIGLVHRKDQRVSELSGGERQLVALARAMIHKPEFIIADEPTGNLDPISTRKVADMLISLHEMGHTIVLITHDESLCAYIKEHTTTRDYTLGQK